MKLRLILPLMFLPSLAWAQGAHSGTWQPLGCVALPSMATAVNLSAVVGGIPAGASLADIQVSSQNVNYRDDGVAPTATTGLTIYANQPWLPYSGPLSIMQLIQTSATATGWVCFYRG